MIRTQKIKFLEVDSREFIHKLFVKYKNISTDTFSISAFSTLSDNLLVLNKTYPFIGKIKIGVAFNYKSNITYYFIDPISGFYIASVHTGNFNGNKYITLINCHGSIHILTYNADTLDFRIDKNLIVLDHVIYTLIDKKIVRIDLIEEIEKVDFASLNLIASNSLLRYKIGDISHFLFDCKSNTFCKKVVEVPNTLSLVQTIIRLNCYPYYHTELEFFIQMLHDLKDNSQVFNIIETKHDFFGRG